MYVTLCHPMQTTPAIEVTNNDASPADTTTPTDDVATQFVETWFATQIGPS